MDMAQRAVKLMKVPSFFNPNNSSKLYGCDYEEVAAKAIEFRNFNNIQPTSKDKKKVSVVMIDNQNTFCLPNGQLYVGGRSGFGAVDNSNNTCSLIYTNLDVISNITYTLDTHLPLQIFHALFWVNDKGEHPSKYMLITLDDVMNGKWKINPEVIYMYDLPEDYDLKTYAQEYIKALNEDNKYLLILWPYHAMVGGAYHALVGTIEEAVMFHCAARQVNPTVKIKGQNPFTESYSAIAPEFISVPTGTVQVDYDFMRCLEKWDYTIWTGQAKSHCVAWTLADYIKYIKQTYSAEKASDMISRIYVAEDCMSSVVTPDMDFTDMADGIFAKFAEEGVHLVKSSTPIKLMEGIEL